MALNVNSNSRRQVSYFGPFYVKNYIASQPHGHQENEGPSNTASAPNTLLDVSKYRIQTVDTDNPSGPPEQTPIREAKEPSGNDDQNTTFDRSKSEVSNNNAFPNVKRTVPKPSNHSRSRSEERHRGNDNVEHVLDKFNEIIEGQYSLGGDHTFKISSTEDNYMLEKFKAKSKSLHEQNTVKHSSKSLVNGREELGEIPQDNEEQHTDIGSSKDFLARHRSKIAKLKKKFFESHTSEKPLPVNNLKNDEKSERNVSDQPPRKPPRSLQNQEHFATESKATMKKNIDPGLLEHRRRHSTDGIIVKADLEEMRMRWSTPSGQYVVVVAIDFGTTYSGYAYSFYHDPDTINLMRRHDSGEPGVYNQKIPTSILLKPDGQFHSFGYAARDAYHDLDQKEASKWMYFDRFKMLLHKEGDLRQDSVLRTLAGKEISAMKVFAYSLAYFKDLAIEEISDQSGLKITCDVVRWVITVPAIWKASAKQFMRQAAYEAGIVTKDQSDHLLIALEPEAASIYCRRLRMFHILSDDTSDRTNNSELSRKSSMSLPELRNNDVSLVSNDLDVGTRYMVVDCGGGTVDITVHELLESGRLKELQKASGGAHGSVGVDEEFESLLSRIFGADIMNHFKRKRPACWVDLMAMFESRKRTASPYRASHIAVSLPYSFIDFYKKTRGSSVASAVRLFGDPEVTWSSDGLLKLSPGVMRRLFLPTVDRIKQSIGSVLNNRKVGGISYMFLVGGFAESSIVQHEMRKDFGKILKIIIPPGVSMTILKGAVCFGQDPHIVNSRCSCYTYGVGVLHRFDSSKHPENKKVSKDGLDWCTDVFDVFVNANQSVELGESIVRRYTPVRRDQTATTINIYSTDRENVEFITDPGVVKCGTLTLALTQVEQADRRREILMEMLFGDTEIRVRALDVSGAHGVEANIDFINL